MALKSHIHLYFVWPPKLLLKSCIKVKYSFFYGICDKIDSYILNILFTILYAVKLYFYTRRKNPDPPALTTKSQKTNRIGLILWIICFLCETREYTFFLSSCSFCLFVFCSPTELLYSWLTGFHVKTFLVLGEKMSFSRISLEH